MIEPRNPLTLTPARRDNDASPRKAGARGSRESPIGDHNVQSNPSPDWRRLAETSVLIPFFFFGAISTDRLGLRQNSDTRRAGQFDWIANRFQAARIGVDSEHDQIVA